MQGSSWCDLRILIFLNANHENIHCVSFFISPANIILAKKLQVNDLTRAYQSSLIAIEIRIPRFSWKLISSQQGVLQRRYSIREGADSELRNKDRKII